MKWYFGFGANRDVAMIRAITGSSAYGVPACVDDYQLCVQQLKDIPEQARKILMGTWGDAFCSYTIVSRPGSRVHGMLWLLTDQQREAVSRWELDGLWSSVVRVDARVSIAGRQFSLMAETEEIVNQQAEEVNGQVYETFVVPREKILQVAREVR